MNKEKKEYIQVIVLNFEQVGQEEYRNITRSKVFGEDSTLKEVNEWIKSIDPSKSLQTAYFNDKIEYNESS